VWIVLARIAWWLNLCQSDEPVADTRSRAQRVASKLSALAAEFDSILVVGHGCFNSLIARALRAQGWDGPEIPRSSYWSAAIYERFNASTDSIPKSTRI
jgi:broad specificity phosphatase PhoE